MSKTYETVIGLEVHVELATKTKIFCGCSTAFGGAPNSHTCPVCTGMPGSLPVLNKQVVEYAMAVGLATNCTITQYCKFDCKNYFYPDNRRTIRFPSCICRSVATAAWRSRRLPAKRRSASTRSIWRKMRENWCTTSGRTCPSWITTVPAFR